MWKLPFEREGVTEKALGKKTLTERNPEIMKSSNIKRVSWHAHTRLPLTPPVSQLPLPVFLPDRVRVVIEPVATRVNSATTMMTANFLVRRPGCLLIDTVYYTLHWMGLERQLDPMTRLASPFLKG